MRLLTLIPLLALTGSTAAIDHRMLIVDEVAAQDEQTEIPVEHVATHDVATGFWHEYTDGSQLYEPYERYAERAGLPALVCSTGRCGAAANPSVKPCDGCGCGCAADSCSCAHSPNVYLTAAKKAEALLPPERQQPSAISVTEAQEPDGVLQQTSASGSPSTAAVFHYARVCEGGVCRWQVVRGRPVLNAATAPARVVHRSVTRIRERQPVRQGLRRLLWWRR